jgi:WD40 repeat protein
VFDPASPLMMIWFEGVVQLVDTDTDEVRDGFLEHELPVRDAAFALGGSRLVTHSGASVITVWNTETMEKVLEIDPGAELYEMPLIEPVRGRMMIANGTDARLYDLGAGAELGEPIVMPWAKSGDSEEDYQSIPLLGRFSPDGTQLAVYTSYHIGLWSAEDGRALGAVTEPGFEMYSVRFVPGDGEVALLGDRDVRFMNLRSGAVSNKVLEHRNFAGDLVASPDGRQLATVAEDRMIRFWDAETGKMLGSPIPVAIMEQDLIYSDDGRSLLAVDAGGMLRLIDTATISELYVWSGQFTHGDIAWQQGKKRLVVWDNDRHLISIDLTDASRLDATPEDVAAVCGAKLLGMNSVRGRPFVREIDSDGTFAAPILRGREGEDVCTAPPVPWWETAAGGVFGWMFK